MAHELFLDLERVEKNVERATTEDLLDRATVYRNGMEPEALNLIDAELKARDVTEADLLAHRERRARTVYAADGLAVKCERCPRPAVVRRGAGIASGAGCRCSHAGTPTATSTCQRRCRKNSPRPLLLLRIEDAVHVGLDDACGWLIQLGAEPAQDGGRIGQLALFQQFGHAPVTPFALGRFAHAVGARDRSMSTCRCSRRIRRAPMIVPLRGRLSVRGKRIT